MNVTVVDKLLHAISKDMRNYSDAEKLTHKDYQKFYFKCVWVLFCILLLKNQKVYLISF